MKQPIQLNGNHEWGDTARQQHRFYSIFGGGRSVAKYSKETEA